MPVDKLFYVGQKAIIEKDGRVLILHHDLHKTDLPGGKIQEGETDVLAALLREVHEETDLTVEDPVPFLTGYFRFHPRMMAKGDKKTELIYIVIYTVKLVSGEVTLSDEHESYKWIGKDDINGLDDPGGLATRALSKFFSK